MTELPELDLLRAIQVLAREYDRLLDVTPEDDRTAAARLAALKSVMGQYVAARKLLEARHGAHPPDLGAMRAAIAQEMPSDDDDDDGDPG